MQYGICLLSVVPCRKEPSGASEMVTQLLFGEHYKVLETKDDWLKISNAYDHYECWISEKQHQRISENTFRQLEKQNPVCSAELVHLITDNQHKRMFPLSIGATLPFYNKGLVKFENHAFEFSGNTINSAEKRTNKDIINTALLFLEAPYLWGGRNLFGIDCSGYTQLVYKLNGYKLPRDAYQQVEAGSALNFVEEAEAGDLAFFDNEEGRIVHVGIVLDSEKIIHASGSVRIDRYDHYGIHHLERKKYSHTLRVIKRIV